MGQYRSRRRAFVKGASLGGADFRSGQLIAYKKAMQKQPRTIADVVIERGGSRAEAERAMQQWK